MEISASTGETPVSPGTLSCSCCPARCTFSLRRCAPWVPALSNLLSLFSWAGFSVLGRRDFPDALRLFLEEASAQEPENTQSEAGSLSPEIHALHLEFPMEHGTRGSPHRTIQKPGLHRVSQTPRKMPSTEPMGTPLEHTDVKYVLCRFKK